MWLKFVKGFSLKEKCIFSVIKISILFLQKRPSYDERSWFLYEVYFVIILPEEQNGCG